MVSLYNMWPLCELSQITGSQTYHSILPERSSDMLSVFLLQQFYHLQLPEWWFHTSACLTNPASVHTGNGPLMLPSSCMTGLVSQTFFWNLILNLLFRFNAIRFDSIRCFSSFSGRRHRWVQMDSKTCFAAFSAILDGYLCVTKDVILW